MEWLKSFLNLWRGEDIEREQRLDREAVSEVRKAIWETKRAMLDGFDDDLFTRQDGWAPRKGCDDKQ